MTRGYYGALPKTEDPRDYLARPAADILGDLDGTYAGPYVDLTAGFPQPPYDQLNLGSCVSNAVAAACDFARAKEGLAPLSCPSRLFVYYNGRVIGGEPLDEDRGLEVRDGLKSLAKYGAPAESEWPYVVAAFAVKPTAKAYADGADDIATVFGAVTKPNVDATVASGYPVVIGFDVYESFETDAVAETGIMPIPAKGEEKLGGHCVLIVSTQIDGAGAISMTDATGQTHTHPVGGVVGRKYYIVRNSWGHDGSWGLPFLPGYFAMPASIVAGSESSDFWQVTTVSSPVAPTPPDPTPPPAPAPTVFTSALAALRQAWADLDAFLRSHGL